MTDLLNRVGRSAFSYFSGETGSDNSFVGNIVEVDGLRVQVTSQLGEGGFAIIYAAKDVASGKTFALKRFLVFDESSMKTVIFELRLLKELKPQPDVVDFITAASIDHSEGRKMKEFLLLMELCSRGDLAKLLQTSKEPLSPRNVCIAMSSLCRALTALHAKSPPVIHRDIKLENMLIDSAGHVKLCDMGSCSTSSHYPNQDWSANQRSLLEDELAKHSTPMYRSPEMLDTWSNFPINEKLDIWAAGCVLFCVCYNQHPFEDGNKLAIVNGNYRIPANDSRYTMYNGLIKSMLTIDPRQRPSATQVLEELSAISETHGFATKGGLDIPLPSTPSPVGLSPSVPTPRSSFPNSPATEEPASGVPSSNSSNQLSAAAASSTAASIKGAAGSIFSKLKDTTKSVVQSVQQSMAGKDLDLHCVTSRVAAMSFPSDGLDPGYRNSIEEVKNMMESQHSGHYTVFNLAEKSYPSTRYPTGNLIHTPWPAGTTPALDVTLELLSNIIEYLAKDARNVVVIHCLDGKSSTAYVICALLIYTTFVTSPQDAVTIFSMRRIEPVITASQMYYLKHLASLVQASPPVLKSPFVSLVNIVVEPIPLFNRAGEGCTPYVEIYQEKARVLSTLQDYGRMKGYSVVAGDENFCVPLNITACGDITISIYHARQVLTKTTGTKICQLQFHTNSLTPGRPSNVWNINQLDAITEPQRFADSFRIVLNCDTSEECSGKSLDWPSPQSKQLLFNSDQDFEATWRLIRHSAKSKDSIQGFGKPLEGEVKITTPTDPPTFSQENSSSKAFDLLGLGSGEPVPTVQQPAKQVPVTSSGDLLAGFSQPDITQSSNNGTSDGFDFLSGLNEPATTPAGVSIPTGPTISAGFADLLGTSTTNSGSVPLMQTDGSMASRPAPSLLDLKPAPPIPSQAKGMSSDPFADLSSISASLSSQNLLNPNPPMGMSSQGMAAGKGPMGMGGSKPTAAGGANNLLGDFDLFGSATTAGTNNNAGGLGGGNNNHMTFNRSASPNSMAGGPTRTGMKTSTSANNLQQPSATAQPNYSRSFFAPQQESVNPNGGVKPRVSQSAFDDILGDFKPSSRDNNQNKTMGQLKKVEIAKVLSPEEMRIQEWTEGKEKNIRTLLSSLHKITWEGARWQECNMSQLVSANDVKKMYRKACLAVHPDKQMDTPNENLSKLIFMELNEAWSEFENDPKQQNLFG